MKHLMNLTISLMVILLISGCTEKIFYTHDCPTVIPLKKVERKILYTDSSRQLTQESSYDAVVMINKYENNEEYYISETTRLKSKVKELRAKNESNRGI